MLTPDTSLILTAHQRTSSRSQPTFSSSEDKAESLALSLLQHGRLLLDHIVTETPRNTEVTRRSGVTAGGRGGGGLPVGGVVVV